MVRVVRLVLVNADATGKARLSRAMPVALAGLVRSASDAGAVATTAHRADPRGAGFGVGQGATASAAVADLAAVAD